MSIIGSNILAGAAGSDVAYEIEQSLRFDNSSAAHLTRTLSASGNRRTFTLSWWLKRGKFNGGTIGPWVWYGANGYESFGVSFSSDSIRVSANVEAQYNIFDKWTAALYRDPSAWMHIVLAIDTTLATAADRVKIYVNGAQVTDLQSPNNNPSQNHQMKWNDHTLTQQWIRGNSGHFDGYQAEIHHVDGTALDPTTFGEYDDNGVWRPIEVELTTAEYGTQGFYLKFDPTATNGIGHDHSGNGNNWTPNNFTTSGNYTDVVGDTPTTNYSTLNPALPSLWAQNISEANTYINTTSSNGGYAAVLSQTVNPANSFYFEIEAYTNGQNSPSGGAPVAVVFVDADQPAKYSTQASTWTFAARHYTKTLDTLGMLWFHYYRDSASGAQQSFYENGSGTSPGTLLTATSGSCETSGGYSGGSPNYSGVPRTGIYYNAAAQEMTLFGADNNGSNAQSAVYDISNWNTDFVKNWAIVFQSQFQTGFLGGGYIRYFASPDQWVISGRPNVSGIAATNLPAPDIADGSDYFNTVLYTGTGATNAINTVGFAQDFLWIKDRDNANGHKLFDRVRGVDAQLTTNSDGAEVSPANQIDSFDSNGFTLDASGSANNSSTPYVAWNWLAGGSGSSNTAGSITSTVSVNPTAGFSIVTYDSNPTGTVGHGLGVAPELIIEKKRDVAADWLVTTNVIDGSLDYLKLNTTNAAASAVITAPTSTVFTPNASGDSMVAYCFASVEGYSKFGSYTGNGSTDGPFVYCGFRPAWLLLKRTDSTSAWFMLDTTRDAYNVSDSYLVADDSIAEGTYTSVDFLSNGFKARNPSSSFNTSGATHVFAAFAENPFGGSGVSPVTAR